MALAAALAAQQSGEEVVGLVGAAQRGIVAALGEDLLGAVEAREVDQRIVRSWAVGAAEEDLAEVDAVAQDRQQHLRQAKNFTDGKVDWAKCRASLQAAMTGSARPRHYTFVFPRPLRASERDHWRDRFVIQQKHLHEQLEQLDYWDDLAQRLATRPDLVNLLSDGALAVYVRPIIEQMAATGTNPLASAVDLSDGAQSVAAQARRIGERDPRFAYGQSGREAGADDHDIPDRRMRFTMSRGQRDELPRYAVTLREGNEIAEITAKPRAGATIAPSEPWFAPGPDGDRLRAFARSQLAKGRPVTLEDDAVGLSPGDIPDRFRTLADDNGVLRNGSLELGLSAPLELIVALIVPGQKQELTQVIQLYRVPSPPEAEMSYAGAVGGAVVAVDLVAADAPPGETRAGDEEPWVECLISVTLAMSGESPRDALVGLGFSRAFGEAERVRFECPGLLPREGLTAEGQRPPGDEEAETWKVAATIALALAGLSERDGRVRRMPERVSPRDLARAEFVQHLLQGGEIAVRQSGSFDVPLPPRARLDDEPTAWASFTDVLPPLLDQPTDLLVEQRVEHAAPVAIVRADSGALRLRCRAEADEAIVVSRLVEPA